MKIKQIEKKIFKEFNIKLAYLFGSQVKGYATPKSDFDIAVLFENNNRYQDFFKDSIYLKEKLRDYFPTEVDIIALNIANSLLRYEVISNGKPLYIENENLRILFEMTSINAYIDDKHIRDLYYNTMKNKIMKKAV